ncbi:MAG: 50S ribosomal protein L5 [Patescibacteria group bacterium]
MKTRLAKKYQTEVIPAMQEKFGFKNKLAVPRIEKVTINVGINSRNTDSGYLENVEKNIIRITGQKPVRTKARQAISAFKIRENMVVGVKVTLRGNRMYDFLDKLINIAIPRIRDFRGLPLKNVDQRGNLNLGFKEHNVFPEIKSDEVEKIHGLEIAVTTTAQTQAEGVELFRLLGFPFQKKS